MSAYLDASILLPILIEERSSAAADHFMTTWSDSLFVSDFAAAEVASALSRLFRTRVLQKSDAINRLDDFDTWRAEATEPLDVQASDVRLASVYVRRFDLMLRTPDALHAAMCRRRGLTLVTLDRRLAIAAKALDVAVHVPGDDGQSPG